MVDWLHTVAIALGGVGPPIIACAAAVCFRWFGNRVIDPRERTASARLPVAAVAATGGLAAAIGVGGNQALALGLFAGLLAALGAIDFAASRLPDRLTLPLLLLGVLASDRPPIDRIAGMSVALVLVGGACLAYRHARGIDGLGFGDVKLAVGCGAWIGAFGVGPMLLFAASSALALIFFGRLLVTTPHVGTLQQTKVPFGPHIALGAFVVALGQGL